LKDVAQSRQVSHRADPLASPCYWALFSHYSEFIIQIIGGKLKTMLKKMFLVSPKLLESMKDSVNKKDNIAPSNNNINKKQKREAGPHADIRAAAEMD
jgi:hypothetical protein